MKTYSPTIAVGLVVALSTSISPSGLNTKNRLTTPRPTVAAAFVLSPYPAQQPLLGFVTTRTRRCAPSPLSIYTTRGGAHRSRHGNKSNSRHFLFAVSQKEEEADALLHRELRGDDFVQDLLRQHQELVAELQRHNDDEHQLLDPPPPIIIESEAPDIHKKEHRFTQPQEVVGRRVVSSKAAAVAKHTAASAVASTTRPPQRAQRAKSIVGATLLSAFACITALTLSRFDDFINAIDLFGTAVFAFGGAVTAGQHGMDLLGMMFIATITAIGGGTTRDVLLGVGKPPFWMRMPAFLHACVVTTLVTFALWPTLERKFHWTDSATVVCTADAFGLAAFAVVGTQKGMDVGTLSPVMWIVSALISCTFGGIIRDVLCRRKPRVLHPDKTLYAPPAILGSVVYTTLLHVWGVQRQMAAAACFVVTFVSRVASFRNPIRLPHWNVREEQQR